MNVVIRFTRKVACHGSWKRM